VYCVILSFFPSFLYMFCSYINFDFQLGREAVGSPRKHFTEFTVILYHRHHNYRN